MRHRDINLLTVGTDTYTPDRRFRGLHVPNSPEWTLQIKGNGRLCRLLQTPINVLLNSWLKFTICCFCTLKSIVKQRRHWTTPVFTSANWVRRRWNLTSSACVSLVSSDMSSTWIPRTVRVDYDHYYVPLLLFFYSVECIKVGGLPIGSRVWRDWWVSSSSIVNSPLPLLVLLIKTLKQRTLKRRHAALWTLPPRLIASL